MIITDWLSCTSSFSSSKEKFFLLKNIVDDNGEPIYQAAFVGYSNKYYATFVVTPFKDLHETLYGNFYLDFDSLDEAKKHCDQFLDKIIRFKALM